MAADKEDAVGDRVAELAAAVADALDEIAATVYAEGCSSHALKSMVAAVLRVRALAEASTEDEGPPCSERSWCGVTMPHYHAVRSVGGGKAAAAPEEGPADVANASDGPEPSPSDDPASPAVEERSCPRCGGRGDGPEAEPWVRRPCPFPACGAHGASPGHVLVPVDPEPAAEPGDDGCDRCWKEAIAQRAARGGGFTNAYCVLNDSAWHRNGHAGDAPSAQALLDALHLANLVEATWHRWQTAKAAELPEGATFYSLLAQAVTDAGWVPADEHTSVTSLEAQAVLTPTAHAAALASLHAQLAEARAAVAERDQEIARLRAGIASQAAIAESRTDALPPGAGRAWIAETGRDLRALLAAPDTGDDHE